MGSSFGVDSEQEDSVGRESVRRACGEGKGNGVRRGKAPQDAAVGATAGGGDESPGQGGDLVVQVSPWHVTVVRSLSVCLLFAFYVDNIPWRTRINYESAS